MLQKMIQSIFGIVSPVFPKLAARGAIELLFRPRKTQRKPHELEFWNKGKELHFKSGCRGRLFGEAKKTAWVIHGWGSRGSKMEKLVNTCLEAGYQVVVWDGPAHGDSPGKRSNLALASRYLAKDVASSGFLADVIIGHSFGAAASAYACRLGLSARQLIFISGPSSSLGFFEDYWDMIALGKKARANFVGMVEAELNVKLEEMSAAAFVGSLNQKVTVIHDRDDKMIPVESALRMKVTREDVDLLITEGQGHHRILKYGPVLSKITTVLASTPKVHRDDVIEVSGAI